MGHLRMGRLPKTRRWTQVVDLLDAGSLDTGALAAAVFEAADYRLRQLANDQGLGYSFWLLTRIALAARGNTFVEDLSRRNCSELRGSEQPAAFQEGIETSGPPGAKEGCQGHLAVGALP